ncbi:aspartate kinase [Acephala macrosclerotiorum]|nr:aspartate kinase [Acephala macrosclerotiorum]
MPLLLPSDNKTWIVQKYGGTSLGKLLPQITENIIPSYLETNKVAVVCSAISGTEKAKGTTSLLLKAIECAITPSRQVELNNIIDIIRDEHFKAIKALGLRSKGGHEKLFNHAEADVTKECEELKSFLTAAQTIGEVSPRSKDRVVSTGEKLSCLIVVAALRSKGVPAHLISLSNIVPPTSTTHNLNANFFTSISSQIRILLSTLPKDAVPVITGFFGPILPSLLQTIGRGYTDLTAALTATALSATELQIWKEVDGIFTADPRKVPSARLLETVTLEEASELTFFGSEVLHPAVAEVVRRGGVRVRVLNVKFPDGKGTVIWPSVEGVVVEHVGGGSGDTTRSNSPANGFMAANGYYGASQSRRAPTALTSKDAIVLVNIQSSRQTKSHGFLAQVFNALDQLNAVADLITSSEQSVSLALSNVDNGDGVEAGIEKVAQALEKCGKVEVQRGMAIVSVIGHKMRNMVGIAGQIFSTLASGGVNIYLIGQGASEINISLVIKEEDALIAMDIIHTNVLGIPRIKTTHTPIFQNSMMKGPWLY